MASIDRALFFESVRQSLFNNKLTQDQVDGMEGILDAFEEDYSLWDLRWLAYALATTAHETGFEMQPIEEYGKGEGAEYGKPDPETGECYYGRGFVQLTWADNYKRADEELGLTDNDSCYLHPERQLEVEVAAPTMFIGMSAGWFRGDKLSDYFNDTRDDPFTAREIINGDKNYTPDWAGGESIGNLIKSYHERFLDALQNAYIETPYPTPVSPDEVTPRVTIVIRRTSNVVVDIVWEDME